MAITKKTEGHLTITDLTDITDVYLQYGLALANATVTNSYTFSGSGEIGWSTTYPTWVSGYQIWIRQVRIKEGMANPEYGTPYLDKAINQTNTTISATQANLTALSTKLKKIWINETTSGTYLAGTYAASGINGTTFSESNPQTYGYNTLLRHNSLDFRYNTINMTTLSTNALTFYIPTQQNNQWVQGIKGLEINSEGVNLYTEKNNNAISIAHFGEYIRLGRGDNTTSNVLINHNSIQLFGKEDAGTLTHPFFKVADMREDNGLAQTTDVFVIGENEISGTSFEKSITTLSNVTLNSVTETIDLSDLSEDTALTWQTLNNNNFRTYTQTITGVEDQSDYVIDYFSSAITSVKINDTTIASGKYTTNNNTLSFDETVTIAESDSIVIQYNAHCINVPNISKLNQLSIFVNGSQLNEDLFIIDSNTSTIYFSTLMTSSTVKISYLLLIYGLSHTAQTITSVTKNGTTLTLNTDYFLSSDQNELRFQTIIEANDSIVISYKYATFTATYPVDANQKITVKKDNVKNSNYTAILIGTNTIEICFPLEVPSHSYLIGYKAIIAPYQYLLNYTPYSINDMQVTINNVSIPQSSTNGWSVVGTNNRNLVLNSGVHPENYLGGFLRVTYSSSSSALKSFLFGRLLEESQTFGAYTSTLGLDNINYGYAAFVTGFKNASYGQATGIIGSENSITWGNNSFMCGYKNSLSGSYGYVEGRDNEALGMGLHIEGSDHDIDANWSHIEGRQHTIEGLSTYIPRQIHIEGINNTVTTSQYTVNNTTYYNSPTASHVEGQQNGIYGASYAHAEGCNCLIQRLSEFNPKSANANTEAGRALPSYAHAQNCGTVATKMAQTVIGSYNIAEDTTVTYHPSKTLAYGTYAFIIGNGQSNSQRSNAFTVQWNGTVNVFQNLYLKKNDTYIYGFDKNNNTRTIAGITANNNVVFGSSYCGLYLHAKAGIRSKQTSYVFNGSSGTLGIGGNLYVDGTARCYGGIMAIKSRITLSNNYALRVTTKAGNYYAVTWIDTSNYVHFGNTSLRTYVKGATLWFDGYATTSSAANARIGTNDVGRLYQCSSSSRKYKYDIKDLIPSTEKGIPSSTIDPSILYNLKVRQFKYNPGYLSKDDVRNGQDVPGFIAEEVNEIYPIAADMGENNQVGDWNVRYMVPPMLALIQQQKKEIDELRARVDALENK